MATSIVSCPSGTVPSVLSIRAESRSWDRIQFWTICAICFPFCLLTAGMDRLKATRRGGKGRPRSFVAEALASAGTSARIALSG